MTVWTRKAHPYYWSYVLNSLGEAHLTGVYGRSSEHQEEAIRCFHLALEVHTREAYAYDWAMNQTKLGIAYRKRLTGDRAANIEQAIACCTAALDVLHDEKYKHDRASAQCQLGQAYVARINGSRQENLAQARAAYNAALEVQTHEKTPLHWAETITAKALLHEALADDAQQRGDHLAARHEREQALALLRETLEVYNAEDFPEQFTNVWAAIKRLEERL
jgi:tetratricopeptide (TPR) repeat protein